MWMVTVPSGGDMQAGLYYRTKQKETHGDKEERLSHTYKWLQSGTQALSTIQTDQESADTDDTHRSYNK